MHTDTIFVLIIIVSIYLDLKDKQTQKCMSQITKQQKAKLVGILVLHHILNIFANFGYLLSNRYLLSLYVFAPFAMIAYWGMNGDRCDITVWANDICGWEGDKYFNDLFNIVGLKKTDWWFKWGHKAYSVVGICIALYRLYNQKGIS